MGHIRSGLHPTILTQTLDGKISTLNTFIEFRIGIGGIVHLGVFWCCIVIGECILISQTLRITGRDNPLHVWVDTIIRQETSTVWVSLTKGNVNRHNLCLSQRVSCEYRRLVEWGDRRRVHVARRQSHKRQSHDW